MYIYAHILFVTGFSRCKIQMHKPQWCKTYYLSTPHRILSERIIINHNNLTYKEYSGLKQGAKTHQTPFGDIPDCALG